MDTDGCYDLLQNHEKIFAIGPWSKVRRGDLRAALEKGELKFSGDPSAPHAVVLLKNYRSAAKIRDFTGEVRCEAPPGQQVIERIAYRAIEDAMALLYTIIGNQPMLFWTWTEHPLDRELRQCSVTAKEVAHKVGAFSEMRTLTCFGDSTRLKLAPLPEWERASLGCMKWWVEQPIAPLVAALQRENPAFSDHYSTYNLRHSWSAIAFRGYGGRTDVIEKPAEMSKRWKAEHPDMMGWKLEDTPLREAVPEVEALLLWFAQFGVLRQDFHRVRIMRLKPGGGELARHADITDPDAGTAEGKIVRLHLPLVTNEKVIFQSWTLDGKMIERHFPAGKWFYLDTRKAHRAVNGGTTDRLHLVVDIPSTPSIREALPHAN